MPRFLLLTICLSAVTTFPPFSTPAIAQIPPAASTPGVWNCVKGDHFTAVVENTRTTTITVNGVTQPARQSTDLLQLYYLFAGTLPGGDAIVQVRITSAQCDAQNQQSPDGAASGRGQSSSSDIERRLIQMLPFQLLVTPDGNVRPVSIQQHQQFIERLAASDASIAALLKKSCPDELYSSWFGRPFWFPKLNLLTDKNTQPWTASCTDSCGPFGVLQTEMNLEQLPPQNGFALCSLKGTPRFVPLVLAATRPSDVPQISLPFTALDIKSGSFTGNARINFNPPADPSDKGSDALPQPAPADDPILTPSSNRSRLITPPFQFLETTLTVSGSGTPGEALQGILKTNNFEFQYSHRCRFTITDFSFRANDRIEALPLPPRPPR
jgi:hypothetical protein